MNAIVIELPKVARIDGGFRIKETPTHFIDVLRMLVNWRVVTTRKDCATWDRGWCYAGTDGAALRAAILAAVAWDGADDTEPAGWLRNLQTGEYGAQFKALPSL